MSDNQVMYPIDRFKDNLKDAVWTIKGSSLTHSFKVDEIDVTILARQNSIIGAYPINMNFKCEKDVDSQSLIDVWASNEIVSWVMTTLTYNTFLKPLLREDGNYLIPGIGLIKPLVENFETHLALRQMIPMPGTNLYFINTENASVPLSEPIYEVLKPWYGDGYKY